MGTTIGRGTGNRPYDVYDKAETVSKAQITGSTPLAGLNADLLDGKHASDLANVDLSNVSSLGALKDFKYQLYSTEQNTYSISAPGANVWFNLPHINMTVGENGIYLIIANIRMWQVTQTTNQKMKKQRILLNGNKLFTFLGLNPANSASNLDGTTTGTYIAPLKFGDVLQVQGYIAVNQSGDVYSSNVDGSSVLAIIKIGEY